MPNERKFPEQKYKLGDNVWFFDNGRIFRGVVLGVKNINVDTNDYLIDYGKNIIATWCNENYLYADKTDLLVAIRDYIVEEERR